MVLHGDCIELMSTLEDHSIDMIFCDLPYGITGLAWDTCIDMQALWKHYKRIIKKGKPIVLTSCQPFTSKLVMSNPRWFRAEWIWQKPNGTNFLNAKKYPMKVHENILVFAESVPRPYNPQMTQGNPWFKSADKIEMRGFYKDRILKRTRRENTSGLRYPKTIQQFNTQVGLHPTQKPVSLCEYFIKTYSHEGDTILDNCAGSGSTAIACINTKRNYIMMEKDEAYVRIIEERIRSHKDKLQL